MSEEIEDMSKLETATALLVATFKEHAGDDNLLNKKEFTKLMNTEMCHLCKKGREKDPKGMDKFFQNMDMDGDGSISFEEFMLNMAGFTCICFGMVCQMEQQCKK